MCSLLGYCDAVYQWPRIVSQWLTAMLIVRNAFARFGCPWLEHFVRIEIVALFANLSQIGEIRVGWTVNTLPGIRVSQFQEKINAKSLTIKYFNIELTIVVVLHMEHRPTVHTISKRMRSATRVSERSFHAHTHTRITLFIHETIA